MKTLVITQGFSFFSVFLESKIGISFLKHTYSVTKSQRTANVGSFCKGLSLDFLRFVQLLTNNRKNETSKANSIPQCLTNKVRTCNWKTNLKETTSCLFSEKVPLSKKLIRVIFSWFLKDTKCFQLYKNFCCVSLVMMLFL